MILSACRQRALQLLVQWREQVNARMCLLVGLQTAPRAHVVDEVLKGHVFRAVVMLLLTVQEGPVANVDLDRQRERRLDWQPLLAAPEDILT